MKQLNTFLTDILPIVAIGEDGRVTEKPNNCYSDIKYNTSKCSGYSVGDCNCATYDKAHKTVKLVTRNEFDAALMHKYNTWSSRGEKSFQYANFLSQPNELGLYIPVDKEGNVMEEPDCLCNAGTGIPGSVDPECISRSQCNEDLEEYRSACDKVIFAGWTYKGIVNKVNGKNGKHLIVNGSTELLLDGKPIEQAIQHGLYYKIKTI